MYINKANNVKNLLFSHSVFNSTRLD